MGAVSEVRRYRMLRHTFLLTAYDHGEILCLIAFRSALSDGVMDRQTDDSQT
jgi:hypothetical protein